MVVRKIYESQRDLLIGQLYKRSNTSVASRAYTYDTLGRPMTRSTSKDSSTVNDSFGYNSRSELNIATANNEAYAYDYDNIGNRETAQEAAESATSYESNQLNQYTAIGDFEPTYDDAGNQTKVKTSTGIWSVVYNAENRPTSFTNADSGTIVECTYDYIGRRATKKVTVNGSVTLHQRFLYRGYLQIACCDLTRSNHPCMWLITWDPSQPVATRPLAIQINGTWYTYGLDLTKNVCEVFGTTGYISTAYTYTPYGDVTATGSTTQPIQWSSEFYDSELALVYYNYRHYNPVDGRWVGRDFIHSSNLYSYCSNRAEHTDILGLRAYVFVLADDMGIMFSEALNEAHNFIEHKKTQVAKILKTELKSSEKCRQGQEYFAWLRSRGVQIKWDNKDFTGTAVQYQEKINRKAFDYYICTLDDIRSIHNFLDELDTKTRDYDTVYVISHSESMTGNSIPENILVSRSDLEPPNLMLKSYFKQYENVKLITCFDGNTKIKIPQITEGDFTWSATKRKKISFVAPKVSYYYE